MVRANSRKTRDRGDKEAEENLAKKKEAARKAAERTEQERKEDEERRRAEKEKADQCTGSEERASQPLSSSSRPPSINDGFHSSKAEAKDAVDELELGDVHDGPLLIWVFAAL